MVFCVEGGVVPGRNGGRGHSRLLNGSRGFPDRAILPPSPGSRGMLRTQQKYQGEGWGQGRSNLVTKRSEVRPEGVSGAAFFVAGTGSSYRIPFSLSACEMPGKRKPASTIDPQENTVWNRVCVYTASKPRFQTCSAGACKSVVGRYRGGRHAEHQSFPHLLRVRLGYNVGHRCVRKGLPSPVRLDVLWTQRSTPSPSDQVALCEIRMGLSL